MMSKLVTAVGAGVDAGHENKNGLPMHDEAARAGSKPAADAFGNGKGRAIRG